MPEGFASIDDLKVAITASTEGLEAGLGSAKAMIDKFTADGSSSLAKFDGGLAKIGNTVAIGRMALLGWIGAAMAAYDATSAFVEKWGAIAGFTKEVEDVKGALSGVGSSIVNGLVAPLTRVEETAGAVNGNITEIQKLAAKGREVVDQETEFSVFKSGELAEIVARQQEAAASGLGQVALAVPRASAALDMYAASARKAADAGLNLANPFGVKRPETWADEIISAINKLKGAWEFLAPDDKKTEGALQGQIDMQMAAFERLRNRLQEMRTQGLTVEGVLFGGESEGALLKRIAAVGERIQALQAELRSRPQADPEEFQKQLDQLEKEAAALDQKARIFGLTADEAAKLVAEERMLNALGFEREELSKGEIERIDEVTERIRENTAALTELQAQKAVSDSIDAITREADAIEHRTKMIGKSADEQARLNAEFRVEQLAKQKNIEIEDPGKLAGAAERLGEATLALKAREAGLAIDRAIGGMADQVGTLELQVALYREGAGAIAAVTAEERLWNEAKKLGRALTDDEIDRVQDLALRQGELVEQKAALDRAKGFERDMASAEKEAEAMERKVRSMFLEAGAAAELTMQTKLLEAARRAGRDLTEQDIETINNLARRFGEATREAKNLEMQLGMIRDSGRLAANALTSAFDQWMRGTEVKGRELVANLLREFAKLTLMRTVLDPGQTWLQGALGGMLGGSSSGIGAWQTSSAPAFAEGGIMPAGVPSIVGERGPELVIPRGGERVIPNHALGGNTSVSVHLTVDARGATRDTLPELERQVAEMQRNLPRIIAETVSEGQDRKMF